MNLAVRPRDSVVAATPPTPPSKQRVNSPSERPGDIVSMDGSVRFMTSPPRVEALSKLRAAVVAKASTLLASVRKTSLHPPELLLVRRAWSTMDHSSWKGQLRDAPTLDLVTALRLAHDEAQETVLPPTP